MVEGPKIAQLIPIRSGPRFLSPEDAMISLFSIADARVYRRVKLLLQTARPSLYLRNVSAIAVVVEKQQMGQCRGSAINETSVGL